MSYKEKITKSMLQHLENLPIEQHKQMICIDMEEYKNLLECKGYKEAYNLLINNLKYVK